jgi:equilibrative nucleoside transporter 1/2/3
MIQSPVACIYFTFFISITIFPVWTSSLVSIHQCSTTKRWANDLYTPLTFVLYNLGDLAGRVLAANAVVHHWVSTRLVLFSLARVLLVLLFFTCATAKEYPWFQFHSDTVSFLVQFSFGCSHGLLLATSFVYAPTLLPKNKNGTSIKIMSEILMFSLALGLLSGSVGSFPISWLVDR